MPKKLSFAIAVNLFTENFKKGANTVKNSLRSMQMQVLTFAAALGVGGLGLSGLVSRFKDVSRETNRVNTALKNVSKGTKEFADNLRFINDLARRYGLEVNTLTGNFAKFTAAATQANMPMEQQRKVFESLSRASAAFGLSASETNGVFMALSQMMGKGKISSEELRKQMGEKLPIAMQAMAKATGVSMAQLENLLKQGKLMSSEVIPKFADALNEMIPDVDTDNLEASINRLSNTFNEIVNSSGFQGKYKALIDSLNQLLKSVGENMRGVTTGILATIAFIVSNAGAKILRGWYATADEMATSQKKLYREMVRTETERVNAGIALDKAIAAQKAATGKAQVTAYKKAQEARKKFELATNIADEADKAHTAAQELSKGTGIITKGFNTVKVGAAKLKVALKQLWATFWPALAIAAAVALYRVVTALNDTQKAQKRLKDATAEFQGEVAKENAQINILFNRLRKAKEGTAGYDKAKNEILSRYGKYLKGLSDEVRALKDVEGAYKAISMAALQAAKDRAIAKSSEAAYDAFGKSFEKKGKVILATLKKRFGEEKGQVLYDQIQESVSTGSGMTEEVAKVLKDSKVDIDSPNGMLRAGRRSTNILAKQVGDLMMTRKTLDDEIQGIRKIFGEATDDKKADDKKRIPTLTQQVKEARQEVDSLKKSLSDLRSGKTVSSDYAKDIQEASKSLKEAQDRLSYLTTGKSYSPPAVGGPKSDNIAEKRLAALKKLDEDDRKRQIDKQKFDLDMQQKAIDQMDEGFEKRIKQIKLNFEKENLEIKEHEDDLLKQQAEYLKNRYESIHGTDKGFDAYFKQLQGAGFKDASGADIMPEGLRPSDIAIRVKQMTDAARKAQEKGLRDINNDLSSMLREQELMFASDLDKKLAEIDAYYNEQRKKAGDNAALIAQIESNRSRENQAATTDDRLQKLDFQEQLEIERTAGMESIGMTELVEEKKLEITKKYLKARIEALQPLADAGDEEAKNQIKLYKEQLNKLDATKPAKGLKALADRTIFNIIKRGFEKAGDSAEDAEKKTTGLLSGITKNAGKVASVVSDLQSMFGGLDEGLDEALTTVGNIAQGFATDGIAGGAMAVISEGMRLFGKASEAAARHQKALKEIEDARLASQRAYNLLLLEQNLLLKEAASIFGEKQITKAANAIKNYRDSIMQLQNELGGNTNQGDGLKKALENAQIVTGHKKTGLFGWGKGKDIYSSILKEYDDIIDAEGKLNMVRVQNIIDTRQMSDETRSYLQNIIALQDATEAAQDELKNYLQSTFGALGNDIMESLENAIKDKGISAWEEFGKAGAEVIEQLGKQIAYQLFFADRFQNLQNQLEAVYGSNKSEKDIANDAMDLVGQFYQNIGSQMELAQGFMENWKSEAKKFGFELFSSDNETSQTASSRGFQSMDQDTGNRLDGRFAALQMSGLRIEGFLSTITLGSSNIFNATLSINDELQKHTNLFNEMKKIHLNSFYEIEGTKGALANISGVLERIDKNTSRI